MSGLKGKVYSHTVVRMPGRVQAEAVPFVLLMVELEGGRRMLAHYAGAEPPAIGTAVMAPPTDKVPVFSPLREAS
jgi:uncharacterized OB-fold protein